MPDDRSAPVPRSAPPRDPNRPSLREIAERSAAAMPRSQRPAAAAAAAHRPVGARPRPLDDENTGYVEVGELRSLYLAGMAKPANGAGADDDDATRLLAPVAPASQANLAYSRSQPPARAARVAVAGRVSGVVAGAVIALIGIGGSALWVARTSAARAAASAAVATESGAAAASSAAPAPPPAAPQPEAIATPAPVTPAQPDPSTTTAAADDPVATVALSNVPAKGATPTPGAASPVRPNAAAAAAPRAPAAKPSDLASAIAAAAAAGTASQPAAVVPAPAAPPAKAAAASGGEQPSQAAVRTSINAVKGAAKACIADADDTSRAQITFAPSGAVSNVVVSGWAADAGVGGCVKSALKSARVDPFSGPPFTVGVTLRP